MSGVEAQGGGKVEKKSLTRAAALGGPISEGMVVDCAFAGVRLCGLHILFSSSAPSLHPHPGEVVCSTLKSECGADKWQAAAVQFCLWHAASCVCARCAKVKTI